MVPDIADFKEQIEESCKDLDPIKHIQNLDFPRRAGTEKGHDAEEYIIETLKKYGHEPKIQEFYLPPAGSPIKKLLLPIVITTWGIASYVNAILAPLQLMIAYILAVLVLMVPLIIVIGVLKMDFFFKLFLKSSRKKLNKLQQHVEEKEQEKNLQITRNIWVEYISESHERELIICGHHDSISLRFGMKILTKSIYIGAIAMILYSIVYFVGFLILPIINIFQLGWHWILMIDVIFMIFTNLALIARIFRTNDSHGSCDDATGIAIILELAKIISKIQPKLKVTLACFAAEEVGLFGSGLFYAKNEASYRRDSIEVISIDMIGEKPPLTIIEKIKPFLPVRTCQRINDEIEQVAGELEINIDRKSFPYPGSDFAHWLLNGFDATWLINPSKYIHSKDDKLKNVNQDLVKQCLKLFVGFLSKR
ncbi:MAG: M28 family metallopeptidase [Candidatus Helarchaeota archaeon]